MRRLWPATKIMLLLAAGVVATDVPGWATAMVLAGWLVYWGWRDDVRWACPTSTTLAVGASTGKFPIGTVLFINHGSPNEERVQVLAHVGPHKVLVGRPGRWVR